MSLLSDLGQRLRALVFRRRLERELTEEMAFHLERETAARIQAGADPDRARREAVRAFGGQAAWREATRDARGTRYLDDLGRDLRHALRGLRRSPGFTATVILTLGLGIGANTAMFNVVDRLMFRPLAYLRDPGSVHRVYWQQLDRGAVATYMSTPYARYLDLERWTTSFARMAGFSERDLAVGEGETARERRVGVVSASYFDFFDARPALGRFFSHDEDLPPRGAAVAVLSHAFWQSEFGGRDVLDQVLQVGDTRARIIGVAPRGFAGVNDANPPALWLPITTFAGSPGDRGASDARLFATSYQSSWMHIMVRRRPGVSREEAEADATQALAQSWRAAVAQDPRTPTPEQADPRVVLSSVRPGAGPVPALEARTATWVLAVAAIVLLIALANVANLSLGRALERQRETSLRLALGVSRWRLVRHALAESLLLALLGGVAALLVAHWAGAAIRRMLIATAAGVPVWADGRTLGVTLVLAIVTGVVVGVVPTLVSGRGDLASSLRGGARGGVSGGHRLRGSLLVIQAALSVMLLIGAALFVRSLQAVRALPMGYEPERVLLVNRILRGQVFQDSTAAQMRRLLMETARGIPGVESVAWMSSAPFVSTSNTDLFVPGVDSVAQLGTFTFQATTPDYFRTMGTRILRGRGLADADQRGAPAVAGVSESMARVLWPTEDAIGRCFRMRSDTMPCTTVVGIAEDMVQRELTGTQRFHYYVSIDQYTRTWGNGMLVRLRGDPVVEAEGVRRTLQRVMPGASYVTVLPLQTIVGDARRSWRLGATMFTAFGVLALVVAAVGLYGIISYRVTQRLHELGVRAALGARHTDLLRLVVGQSLRLAVAGVVVGMLLALLTSRWVEPLLFRQSGTDPVVYGAVSGLMLVVAVVASVVPARRAARVDPNAALRAEGA